jgi:hypothetical protein
MTSLIASTKTDPSTTTVRTKATMFATNGTNTANEDGANNNN